MNQACLSFADTRARRTDPITSKLAASNAAHFATTHAGRIHAALQLNGPRTAHELSALIGLTVVQIDRRLPELKATGLAHVMKHDDGADYVRQGCRVWMAA